MHIKFPFHRMQDSRFFLNSNFSPSEIFAQSVTLRFTLAPGLCLTAPEFLTFAKIRAVWSRNCELTEKSRILYWQALFYHMPAIYDVTHVGVSRVTCQLRHNDVKIKAVH